jgi:hypothetical protein
MRLVGLAVILASSAAVAQPSSAPGATPPSAPSAPPPRTAAPPPAPPPASRLSEIAIEELPESCRELGTLAGSPSPAQALSARISLAGCLVEQSVRTLQLCDCEQSVNEVEAAASPSIALLDEVFAAGDPAMKILARQAEGDMLQGFATRLLATVPPLVDTNESAVALRELRLNMLTPLVNPWFVRARSAYTELDRIAREHPELAKNRAVLIAVRSARAKLAQGIGSGVANR